MNNYKWTCIQEDCVGWENTTFYDKLCELSEKIPDKCAIVDDEVQLTYSELKNEADRIAAYLRSRDINKGDHVVLQLVNNAFFVKVMFALFRIGAMPILLLPSHRLSVIDGVISKTRPRAYITVRNQYNFSYEKLAQEAIAKSKQEIMLMTDELLEKVSVFEEDAAYEEVSYKDIAVLLLSGGTTGIPKLIARTHGDYIYNAKVTAERCGCDSNTVYLAALPVAHNFPLNAPGIFGCMLLGGKAVLTLYSSPLDLFDTIQMHAVTSTSLVPALLKMFTQYRQIDKVTDLSSLKSVLVGGAMLYPADAEAFINEHGPILIQVFGTAEGLICMTNPDDNMDIVLTTQGTPCSPYDEIKIISSDGEVLEAGETGEMITRGPYTITSYYLCPEAQKIAFTEDGWYRTGDLAVIDENGKIRITGRMKEMINRAGEKIIPSELEEIFTEENIAENLAIVGVPDEMLGSRICLCYKNENELCKDDVNEILRRRQIAEFQFVDETYRIEEWPLTPVGKTDKKELLAIMLKGGI